MIIGIGTDICDARRIKRIMVRFSDKFVTRIFTPAEIALASTKADPSLFYAKRFAAKEAVYKALSASRSTDRSWQDAEVLNDEDGVPLLSLSGGCKTALEALTPDGYNAQIDVSLSDEPPYAVAFVVLSIVPK